jgi:two-component system response regulator AgrA
MIPIFICEDDSLQKSVIESIIYKKILIEEYDMKIELSTADPYELKKHIDSRDSIGGVYFLDIDFNTDINGIQLASYIRKKDINAKIIFITTHSELLQLTFEYKVEALDYIIKDNVTLIQQKIFDCLENAYSYYTSDKNEDMDKVKFKIGNTVKLLSLEKWFF